MFPALVLLASLRDKLGLALEMIQGTTRKISNGYMFVLNYPEKSTRKKKARSLRPNGMGRKTRKTSWIQKLYFISDCCNNNVFTVPR